MDDLDGLWALADTLLRYDSGGFGGLDLSRDSAEIISRLGGKLRRPKAALVSLKRTAGAAGIGTEVAIVTIQLKLEFGPAGIGIYLR
jgi:hypothetical protein